MSVTVLRPKSHHDKDMFRGKCMCGNELKAKRIDLNEDESAICPCCNKVVQFNFWYKYTINRGGDHGAAVM